ncbi:hypothetical protein TWF970_001272 [Orbilia oligospora]|uniref:Nucleoside phosphorylase domain-containing protein n=1 Tax=Orbilia oligospora TaxID=2813651 RepID=A0A7C8V9Q2_ORBOL|nr:hypothetical protein TWF970_001272 [Orbilia oligospora]
MLSGTDDSPSEMAEMVFPIISELAAQLGQDTRKGDFGRLSGLLTLALVTIETLPSLPPQKADMFENRTRDVLQLLEKACTWPRAPNRASHISRSRILGFPTLKGLIKARDRLKSPATLKQSYACAYRGLRDFFSKRCYEGEAKALLEILNGAKMAQSFTADEMGLTDKMSEKNATPGYPAHVNESLYFALVEHTFCSCDVEHLKLARLRLDATEEFQDESVPFELAFSSLPTNFQNYSLQSESWQETMILVRKRIGKKQVFQDTESPRLPREHPEGEVLAHGDLCKHLSVRKSIPSMFNLSLEDSSSVPILREYMCAATPFRNIKSPQSISFARFLEEFRAQMSILDKFLLAYLLAKSVWQYHGSKWMRNPWTHNDIHFLEEEKAARNHKNVILASYNPYIVPHFTTSENCVGEYFLTSPGQLLSHRYPGILALAVMLIDIIGGRLPQEFRANEPYTYEKTRKCFISASIAKNELNCDVIYKGVIEKCLDSRLFERENAQFDPKEPQKGLKIRQSIIYKEIVRPLKYLMSIPNVASELPINRGGNPGHFGGGPTLNPIGTGSIPVPYQQNMSPVPICQSPYSPLILQASPGPLDARNPRLRTGSDLNVLHVPGLHKRPTSRSEFEIAIICALQTEYEAVELLIDEFWDETEGATPYRRAQGDQNTYTNGRIGKHNVVLTLLPGAGKVNSAKASSNLLISYPGIRLTLLVGICGGVPTYGEGKDIVLGDVVISSSITQYDFGSQLPNGFYCKKPFETPNTYIISPFLGKIQTSRNMKALKSRAFQHLQAIQRISTEEAKKYMYPGTSEDTLFQASSLHKHHASSDCDICKKCIKGSDPVCREALETLCTELRCDEKLIVLREKIARRTEVEISELDGHFHPIIHFGRMGSGDTVMKSGIYRDEIAEHYGVIAFEMEGAGIWDNPPWIIIKGVCDYADCHKNKKWQNFAAASAAAATKALLEQYNGTDGQSHPLTTCFGLIEANHAGG